MASLKRLHRDMGQVGHLGEFFLLLGFFILVGAVALGIWGQYAEPGNSGTTVRVDALTTASVYVFMGLGTMVAGAVMILSGWSRRHPEFDSHDGEDPARR